MPLMHQNLRPFLYTLRAVILWKQNNIRIQPNGKLIGNTCDDNIRRIRVSDIAISRAKDTCAGATNRPFALLARHPHTAKYDTLYAIKNTGQ